MLVYPTEQELSASLGSLQDNSDGGVSSTTYLLRSITTVQNLPYVVME